MPTDLLAWREGIICLLILIHMFFLDFRGENCNCHVVVRYLFSFLFMRLPWSSTSSISIGLHLKEIILNQIFLFDYFQSKHFVFWSLFTLVLIKYFLLILVLICKSTVDLPTWRSFLFYLILNSCFSQTQLLSFWM